MHIIDLKDLTIGAKETPGWYQIEVNGDHTNYLADGRQVDFTIDEEVIDQIITAGLPPAGLSLDEDHLSHDSDKTSEALGWIKQLAKFYDEDGVAQLAGVIDWASAWRERIDGGAYKFFSTEFNIPADILESTKEGEVITFRPDRLDGLALTNHPNNEGGKPITNSKASSKVGLLRNNKALVATRATITNTTTNNHTNMEELQKIAMALGLSEDATLSEILSKITDVQNTACSAKNDEAETLVNNELGEGAEDLTAEEKMDLVEQIVENRDKGLRMLNLIKNAKVKPKTPQYARPTDHKVKNRGAGNALADLGRAIRSRADELIANSKAKGQKMSMARAWQVASAEIKAAAK